MGIRGLSSYIRSNPNNFSPFLLHDTYVVIDGFNFIYFLYFKLRLYTQFNGEYLDFDIQTEAFLRKLEKCQIKPVFVFDGIQENVKMKTILNRAREKLTACFRLQISSNESIDACNPDFHISLCPLLSSECFICTLNRLNVLHVTVDGEVDQFAAALAIKLRCPIISNDSDFYILGPYWEAVNEFCYIPLDFCNFEPIVCETALCFCSENVACGMEKPPKKCYHIKVQRFCPEVDVFRNLLPPLRPIFAALCDNDYVPRGFFYRTLLQINFLRDFNKKHQETSCSQVSSRQCNKFCALIHFISTFGSDVGRAVESILDTFSEDQRKEASEHFFNALRCFTIEDVLNSSMMEDCLHFLFSSITDPNLATNFSQNHLLTNKVGEPQTYGKMALEILHKNVSTNNPIFSSWPKSLVNFIRKRRMKPFLCSALYSSSCVFSPVVEDIIHRETFQLCALPIRKCIYGLLFYIKISNSSATFQLPGFRSSLERPFVIEYERTGSSEIQPKLVRIDVIKPVEFSSTDQRFLFLSDLLDLPSMNNTLPSWFHSLVCLYIIWFRSERKFTKSMCTSAIGLSLIVCSVVTCELLFSSNSCDKQRSLFNLHKRFMRTLSQFTTNGVVLAPLPSSKYKISLINSQVKPLTFHFLHAIAQVQVIHTYFKDLSALIDSFSCIECTQTCLDLPPAQYVFPSGLLVHHLALQISTIPQESRLTAVVDDIISRLLAIQLCDTTGKVLQHTLVSRVSYMVVKLVKVIDSSIPVFQPNCELTLKTENASVSKTRELDQNIAGKSHKTNKKDSLSNKRISDRIIPNLPSKPWSRRSVRISDSWQKRESQYNEDPKHDKDICNKFSNINI